MSMVPGPNAVQLFSGFPCPPATAVTRAAYIFRHAASFYRLLFTLVPPDGRVATAYHTLLWLRLAVAVILPSALHTRVAPWLVIVQRLLPGTVLLGAVLGAGGGTGQPPSELAVWFLRISPFLDLLSTAIMPASFLAEAVYGALAVPIMTALALRYAALHPRLGLPAPPRVLLLQAAVTAVLLLVEARRARGRRPPRRARAAAAKRAAAGEAGCGVAGSAGGGAAAATEEQPAWRGAGDAVPSGSGGGAAGARLLLSRARALWDVAPAAGTGGPPPWALPPPPSPPGSLRPPDAAEPAGAAALQPPGVWPPYVRRVRMLRCAVKLGGVEPEQVTPGHLERLAAAVAAAGHRLEGAYLRRGCCELVVDVRVWAGARGSGAGSGSGAGWTAGPGAAGGLDSGGGAAAAAAALAGWAAAAAEEEGSRLAAAEGVSLLARQRSMAGSDGAPVPPFDSLLTSSAASSPGPRRLRGGGAAAAAVQALAAAEPADFDAAAAEAGGILTPASATPRSRSRSQPGSLDIGSLIRALQLPYGEASLEYAVSYSWGDEVPYGGGGGGGGAGGGDGEEADAAALRLSLGSVVLDGPEVPAAGRTAARGADAPDGSLPLDQEPRGGGDGEAADGGACAILAVRPRVLLMPPDSSAAAPAAAAAAAGPSVAGAGAAPEPVARLWLGVWWLPAGSGAAASAPAPQVLVRSQGLCLPTCVSVYDSLPQPHGHSRSQLSASGAEEGWPPRAGGDELGQDDVLPCRDGLPQQQPLQLLAAHSAAASAAAAAGGMVRGLEVGLLALPPLPGLLLVEARPGARAGRWPVVPVLLVGDAQVATELQLLVEGWQGEPAECHDIVTDLGCFMHAAARAAAAAQGVGQADAAAAGAGVEGVAEEAGAGAGGAMPRARLLDLGLHLLHWLQAGGGAEWPCTLAWLRATLLEVGGGAAAALLGAPEAERAALARPAPGGGGGAAAAAAAVEPSSEVQQGADGAAAAAAVAAAAAGGGCVEARRVGDFVTALARVRAGRGVDGGEEGSEGSSPKVRTPTASGGGGSASVFVSASSEGVAPAAAAAGGGGGGAPAQAAWVAAAAALRRRSYAAAAAGADTDGRGGALAAPAPQRATGGGGGGGVQAGGYEALVAEVSAGQMHVLFALLLVLYAVVVARASGLRGAAPLAPGPTPAPAPPRPHLLLDLAPSLLAVLPILATAAAWPLLTHAAWVRLVRACMLPRLAAHLAAGLLVGWGGAAPSADVSGYHLGPAVLVGDGVLVLGTALVPPATAAVLAALRVPVYVRMWAAMGAPFGPAYAWARAGLVSGLALATNLLCHALLRRVHARQAAAAEAAAQGGKAAE